jgi:hypothetical protein
MIVATSTLSYGSGTWTIITIKRRGGLRDMTFWNTKGII